MGHACDKCGKFHDRGEGSSWLSVPSSDISSGLELTRCAGCVKSFGPIAAPLGCKPSVAGVVGAIEFRRLSTTSLRPRMAAALSDLRPDRGVLVTKRGRILGALVHPESVGVEVASEDDAEEIRSSHAASEGVKIYPAVRAVVLGDSSTDVLAGLEGEIGHDAPTAPEETPR